jgi:ferrochelatase
MPILHGIILRTRPAKSAHAYAQVWTRRDRLWPRSPPRRRGLQARLGVGDAVMVDWAMRYGQPSIPAVLEKMKAAGCERILVARSIRNIRAPPRPA